MAFLCQARKKQKKKKEKEAQSPFMGRITGSASVDTLVRVGLEKQHGLSPDSRMKVTQDFMATIEDELSAQTGDVVYMLYRDNDWIYVITEQGQEGFMPFMCVVPCDDVKSNPKRGSSKQKKRRHLDVHAEVTDGSMEAEEGSDISAGLVSNTISQTKSNPIPKPATTLSIPDVISNNGHVDQNSSHRLGHESDTSIERLGTTSSQTSLNDPITEVKTFKKKSQGKFLVVFGFEATDENDLEVERGEVVTALNKEDPLWTWVKRLNGKEGFVPASFMCPFPEDLSTGSTNNSSKDRPASSNKGTTYHDVRELTTLRHFTAQSADDISVVGGEQVFADLANQIEKDWLWVYAPSTGQYGYIPRDNVMLAQKHSENAQRPP